MTEQTFDEQRFTRGLAVLLGVLAIGVLIGWAFDIRVLKSIMPGLTTMKANTAIALGMAAIAIALTGSRWRTLSAAAAAAACIVAAIGTATLLEYALHIRLGLDELVFLDRDTTSRPFSGRMSPATAMAFVGVGTSLCLLALGRSRRTLLAGHVLAIVPGAIGFLSLAGYAYGVENLYNFGPFVSVALHTGIGLIFVAIAIVLLRRNEGWAASLVDRPVARLVLIQIAILSILIPFLTGLFVVRGVRAGFYQAQFTPALFAVAAAVSLLWLAFRSSHILGKAEGKMLAARHALSVRELELAQVGDRHRALVERLPQLVWTAKPDGQVDYFSTQWVEYTGVGEAEQLGSAWLDNVVHPEDVDRTRAHWAGAVAGDHSYDIDYRIRSAAGDYRWFKVRGTPIAGPDGKIGYWFGTATDIEDIVRAREFLTRSRRDLESQVAARTAELMAVEAQLRQSQKMEAVGQLTGGVAHDFNNLLTIIRSASDLLRRPDLAEDRRRRYLDAISETADRAAKLTAQLLAFSRRQALKPEVFDAAERIAGIVEMLASLVGSRIPIVFEPVCEPCFMEADAAQFETALVNMAVNARDAMNGEGLLTITLESAVEIPSQRGHDPHPGWFVAVSITDSGSGISPDMIDHIFEPFFTTKEVGKGTGLGLSQVFGFAKQSRGDVLVENNPEGGATFTLYLPHVEALAERQVTTPIERRQMPVDGKGRTVLVVEDNVDVGIFSTQLLEDLGYRTTWCGNAADALAKLEEGCQFDAVFSDVVMPGMSGIELGHEIRRRFPGLPVILTSGYSDVLADEGRHGFELLGKPYAVEDLSRMLRRAVSSNAARN